MRSISKSESFSSQLRVSEIGEAHISGVEPDDAGVECVKGYKGYRDIRDIRYMRS